LFAAVLASLLAGQVWAGQGAEGIPVPLPEAPALPSMEDLQAERMYLEGFMAGADQYIGALSTTTERYRIYVANVKEQVAGCEIEKERKNHENHPFRGVMERGSEACLRWMENYREVAQQQQRVLDEAMAFQKQLLEAAESVQGQLQQVALYESALQLKEQVTRGIQDIEDSKIILQPWME
jgi:hypothetical protein